MVVNMTFNQESFCQAADLDLKAWNKKIKQTHIHRKQTTSTTTIIANL